MLRLLRRIPFPTGLQTSGHVVKANLLSHVADFYGLIRKGEEEAQRIIDQARKEAELIRGHAREEALAELQAELGRLQLLTQVQDQQHRDKSAKICLEVCKSVLDQMFETAEASQKIRSLVDALLEATYSARELTLHAHPLQVDLVRNELAEALGTQFNLRRCTVSPSEELQPYELNITTSNGAHIMVSIDNLLHMYKKEIDTLEPAIDLAFQGSEVHNAVTT